MIIVVVSVLAGVVIGHLLTDEISDVVEKAKEVVNKLRNR